MTHRQRLILLVCAVIGWTGSTAALAATHVHL